MKRLFTLHTNLQSYTYPVIKIVVCIIFILVSIFRNQIFPIPNGFVSVLVTVFCVLLASPIFLCIYIAVAELFYTYGNRKSAKKPSKNAVMLFPLEKIVNLAAENDIIEFEIRSGGKTTRLGQVRTAIKPLQPFLTKDTTLTTANFSRSEPFGMR